MELEFVMSQKGKPMLFYNGHKYLKKNDSKRGDSVWYCSGRDPGGCRGKVKVKDGQITSFVEHQCTPDVVKLEKIKAISRAKMRASQENAPISQIFKEELGPLQQYDNVTRMPRFDSLKSTLYRQRKKVKAMESTEAKTADISGFKADDGGDPLVVTEHDFNHNHENDELKCAKKSISNSCKSKAEDDLYSKPCKILKEEIASCSNKEVLTEKDICNMRKVMWNARKKTLPPLPKNVEETLEQLDELSLMTDRNEQFLLENDHNKKIFCKTNVDELKTATTVLMDGLASVSAQQPGPSTFQAHVTSSPLPTIIPIAPVNVPHTPLASDNVNSVSSSAPSQLIPSPAPLTTMSLHLPPSPLGPPVDTVNVPPPHLPPSSMAPAPPTLPTTNDTCITVQWNSYATNMSTAMPNLLEDEKFVDVTLACDGKYIKCHKIILGACSPYFEDLLLSASPGQHPIILMKDFEFWEIKAIVDFIYCGSVNIPQDKLPNILQVANKLQIKGLMGSKNNESKADEFDTDDLSSSSNTLTPTATSVRTYKRPNKEKLNATKKKISRNTPQTPKPPSLERPSTSTSTEPHNKQPKLFHSHLQDDSSSSSSLRSDTGFSLLDSGPAMTSSFILPPESITIKEESSFMDPPRLDDNPHSLFLSEPIDVMNLQHSIKLEPEEPPEVHDDRIDPINILPGPSGSGQHFS